MRIRTSTRIRFGICNVSILLVSSLCSIKAAQLFVSTQGNDSNPGTSAKPFRTITYAYSIARPGDTLRVTWTHDAALRSMLPELKPLQPRYVMWGDGTSDEMCLAIMATARTA